MEQQNLGREEKKKKPSTIGNVIGRILQEETWTPQKIIFLAIVLVLPLGPMCVAAYFGIREYKRRKRESSEKSQPVECME